MNQPTVIVCDSFAACSVVGWLVVHFAAINELGQILAGWLTATAAFISIAGYVYKRYQKWRGR